MNRPTVENRPPARSGPQSISDSPGTDEKPYRVYRSGRARLVARPGPQPGRDSGGRLIDERGLGAGKPPSRGRRSNRRKLLLLGGALVPLVLVVIAVWGALGYFAVSGGVADANKRLPAGVRAVLARSSGSLLSTPTNVLLLGTDHSAATDRASDQHSDSMMLLRVDPGRHRLVYVSIPRDLLVRVPGYGTTKINAAMQIGGPALAIRTVGAFTGLPINHVAVVNFGSFAQLIDAVGGVTINVPEAIASDQFDCPYSASRCANWPGWRFAKGPQHMDARQALVYSRIRVNRLNPADSDVTRALHQQQVMQAVLAKLASVSTFASLPFDGGSLLKPLSTDLSAWDFLELAWTKFRASATLHCRLGGSSDGRGDIVPDVGNTEVLDEALGKAPPRAPSISQGLYAPGCVSGSRPFPQ